jgi:hypothetical protein
MMVLALIARMFGMTIYVLEGDRNSQPGQKEEYFG